MKSSLYLILITFVNYCLSKEKTTHSSDIKRSKKCFLPIISGECENKLIDRYAFNQYFETCYPFYYSGCDGNENNFKTLDECVKQCKPQNQTIIVEVTPRTRKPTIKPTIKKEIKTTTELEEDYDDDETTRTPKRKKRK